jgi:hypothetical protein
VDKKEGGENKKRQSIEAKLAMDAEETRKLADKNF